MKILFITANRVGDGVLSTGVLRWLVTRYPGSKFTIACGPYAADLFRATPGLERLIILHKRTWNRHWLDLWTSCVRTRWDLIVDLRNSFAARLLRAGQRMHRGGSSGQHKVIENAKLLDLNPPPAPFVWLDAEAETACKKILPSRRPLLALGPAANWPPKQWPLEFFVALAQKLTAETGPLFGAPILVIAGESERALIAPLLDAFSKGQCVAVIGQDLLMVAACLKECALFIGNDSGLMHLAAAIGTKTLGLFGPGQENVYGPWGGTAIRTLESREELLSRLPYPGADHPNLMRGLSVETVYQTACGLLQKHL